jgi:hypothetical protein
MSSPYTTRSGRVVRPPAVPSMPLPPEETDDEELDPMFDPACPSPSSSETETTTDDDDDDWEDDEDSDSSDMEVD